MVDQDQLGIVDIQPIPVVGKYTQVLTTEVGHRAIFGHTLMLMLMEGLALSIGLKVKANMVLNRHPEIN